MEDHLDRMAKGCDFFHLPFSRQGASDALQKAVKGIPEDKEARLRLTLVCYGGHDVQQTSYETSWEVLDQSRDLETVKPRLALAPFSRFSGSPLVRFKTTSYMENMFVLRWARQKGCFDAVFTNERGHITEGSITNIFFLTKNKMVTPSTQAGLLAGITRRYVLAISRALGIPSIEETIPLDSLENFDSAFVTNSVIEMLEIDSIGNTVYQPSELVATIHKAYREQIPQHLSLP